ncbi:MAG: hypothetical protein M5U28_39820 [Sandaracinaceae bacterium]|nr:hypothetical protein [Sandaracinaceae bacterium]
MTARWRACLALLLAGCPGPTGTMEDGGGIGCGELTFEGVCEGDIARWCEEGVPYSLDCISLASHVECDSIAGWGADCVADDGLACAVSVEGRPVNLTCRSEGSGCVWREESVTCQSGVGACAEADVGTCRGELAIFDCRAGRPVANDCASWSGRCDAGACVDMPAGAPCLDGFAICAAGLACVDGTCAGGGGALVLRVPEGTLRDGHLRAEEVHLYASAPRWYVGDRPADVPAPVMSASFVDWVATFEAVPPGHYFYDFSWIADTGRFAYGTGELDVAGAFTEVDVSWSYVGVEANPDQYTIYDATEPLGVLVFHTSDAAVDTAQLGLTPSIEGADLTQITLSWTASGRCGEPSDAHRIVVVIPAGTYSVQGSAIDAGGTYLRWRVRSVSVAAGACRFVDMGVHDCTGIGC